MLANNETCFAFNVNETVSLNPGVAVLLSTCAVVFTVIGVVGNFLTLLALLFSPKLRDQTTTVFVLSLTVSDLLYCAFNLPLFASLYIYRCLAFPSIVCQLFVYTNYGNTAASLMSIACITVNRCILIVHPSWYPRVYTRLSIIAMLVLSWSLGFIFMTMPLFGVWGDLGYDAKANQCSILEKDGRSPKMAMIITGIVIPCIVIILCYARILCKLRSSRRILEAHKSQRIADVVAKHQREQEGGRGSRSRGQEDMRLTAMILVIFMCFMACFAPRLVIGIVDPKVEWSTAHGLSYIPMWASSVINPFIYVISNKKYRNAYFSLLRWRRSSISSTAVVRFSTGHGSSQC